jgi:hypothetical protein
VPADPRTADARSSGPASAGTTVSPQPAATPAGAVPDHIATVAAPAVATPLDTGATPSALPAGPLAAVGFTHDTRADAASPAPVAAGSAPRAMLARRPSGAPPSRPGVPRPPDLSAAPRRTPIPAAGVRTLARAAGDAPAAGSGGGGAAGAGGGGGGGGGGDGDQVFSEVMRRVREEQEQLGQLISHPF